MGKARLSRALILLVVLALAGCRVSVELDAPVIVTATAPPESTPPSTATPTPLAAVVGVLLFYSSSCPHCAAIIDGFLPEVQQKYGSSLQVERASIDEILGYRLLMYVCDVAGVSEDGRGVPLMLVGENVLIGAASIRGAL
ncbi:MAG: hypothetical protein ACUVWR_16235 [Anaerolineae bacterium]